MRTARDSDPSSDLNPLPSGARATARTLLEAYYHQDEREGHLLRGEPRRAVAAGVKALDRMAIAYEVEFPHVDRRRARSAGEAFMRALFVQDEIENWELIEGGDTCDLHGVLLSDPSASYGSNPVNDTRWEVVRTHLRETCREVGIDERYAEKQTQFWLLHGQLNEYWEEIALEAHDIKVRAMIDDPPQAAVDRMGERFVEGVKIHDGWSHQDETEDLNEVISQVAAYYREVFELRSRS